MNTKKTYLGILAAAILLLAPGMARAEEQFIAKAKINQVFVDRKDIGIMKAFDFKSVDVLIDAKEAIAILNVIWTYKGKRDLNFAQFKANLLDVRELQGKMRYAITLRSDDRGGETTVDLNLLPKVQAPHNIVEAIAAIEAAGGPALEQTTVEVNAKAAQAQ